MPYLNAGMPSEAGVDDDPYAERCPSCWRFGDDCACEEPPGGASLWGGMIEPDPEDVEAAMRSEFEEVSDAEVSGA